MFKPSRRDPAALNRILLTTEGWLSDVVAAALRCAPASRRRPRLADHRPAVADDDAIYEGGPWSTDRHFIAGAVPLP